MRSNESIADFPHQNAKAANACMSPTVSVVLTLMLMHNQHAHGNRYTRHHG